MFIALRLTAKLFRPRPYPVTIVMSADARPYPHPSELAYHMLEAALKAISSRSDTHKERYKAQPLVTIADSNAWCCIPEDLDANFDMMFSLLSHINWKSPPAHYLGIVLSWLSFHYKKRTGCAPDLPV